MHIQYENWKRESLKLQLYPYTIRPTVHIVYLINQDSPAHKYYWKHNSTKIGFNCWLRNPHLINNIHKQIQL